MPAQDLRRQTAVAGDGGTRGRGFGVGAVILGLLYILILAAATARYVFAAMERDELRDKYEELRDVHGRLQDALTNMSSNEKLQELQDEVKLLKEQMEGRRCPEGWTRFGCSCYFRSTETMYWKRSREWCQEQGADLVVINSRREQEFVHELRGMEEFWIGLFAEERDSELEWQWVDGSPLTETFWADGHPYIGVVNAPVFCCDDEGLWRQTISTKSLWICEK